MTKSYKVAGHVFALELPDTSPLWYELEQYEPFFTEETCPIFTLRVSDSLPEGERTIVYDPELEPGETLVRIFDQGGDFVVEMSPSYDIPSVAKLWISSDFSSAVLQFLNKSVSSAVFSINNSMMLVFAFRTACLNTLEIHASVIRCEEKAFLFLARSGTGKSTHSNLWLRHIPGSELLNDDNPLVRYHPEDGSVVCYGSPWSGKTPCYRNESAPVGAFVRIRRSRENSIVPLDVFNAYALLYSSSSGFKVDRKMADGLHETVSAIVERSRCFELGCRPDKEAAVICSEAVL